MIDHFKKTDYLITIRPPIDKTIAFKLLQQFEIQHYFLNKKYPHYAPRPLKK